MLQTPAQADTKGWTGADAAELYRVESWGDGFYHVNEHGHAAVRPLDDPALTIDLVDVVADIRKRGLHPPILIR